MIKKSLVKLLVFGVFSFIFGVLVMAAFSFASKTNASSPDVAAGPVAAVSNPLAINQINCTPVFVAVFSNRIHVECAAAVGGIKYFAAPTSGTENAARMLSLASTAQVAGRTLIVWYDPANTGGTSFGCGASDCRTINGLAFGN